MMKKQPTQRRRVQKRPKTMRILFYAFVVLGLCVLVSLGSLRDFLNAYNRRNSEAEMSRVLDRKIENLRKAKKTLRRGPRESERIVRERYKLIKPGEKLILIKEIEEEIQN